MTNSDVMFSMKLITLFSAFTLPQTMGPGVFYDYNPEMLSNMEDVIKEEKMSQLVLFYRGKFGHDPDPFFWSFDPSAVAFAGGAAFQPPVPPPAPHRFPRGGGGGGADDHQPQPPPGVALRRAINPNALYPAGSGRFPRDLSGTMRTGRHDRFPRAMPASPGGRPFNDRWNEDSDDAKSDVSKDHGAGGDSAPSAPKAPYLPNLKNFIGNYHESLPEGKQKKDDVVVEGGVEDGASAVAAMGRDRSAQRMQCCDDDSEWEMRFLGSGPEGGDVLQNRGILCVHPYVRNPFQPGIWGLQPGFWATS